MDKVNIINGKNIIVFILIVGVIALSIFSLDIILLLFGSFVIACAIDPILSKMEKIMPRTGAVAIVILALILASILILVPIISISIKEIAELVNSFPAILDNLDKLLNFKIFNHSISSMVTLESLKEPLVNGAKGVIENSIVLGKHVANIFTMGFAMAIVIFYLASDKERLTNKFVEFFPNEQKETARKIIDNISQKVGNYIFAQGLAMIFVGVLTTIGLILINNNHAFLLGFLTCILDIVPVVGPAIAVVAGVLSSVGNGVLAIVLTLLVFGLAQWAQNQLLKPVLFGKMLNMHPLLIIVALLLSAKFLGFWGVILSPAIASVVCVLVDELYLNRINNK